MYKIPILILTFNRPESLKKLLSQIKKINPSKIYVSCDGPKNNDDKIKIQKIKDILKIKLNKTKILTNFSKKNKGVKLGPQSGITWFFKNEKLGIILEDDCIPSSLFFRYTSQLLIKYKKNKKIFAISGYNHFEKTNFGDGFYFVSNYFLGWGWATWSRSWNNSNKNISIFNKNFFLKTLNKKFSDTLEIKYWLKVINFFYLNKIVGWDMQFMASMWKKKSYCILPNINMINNIGFTVDGSTSPGLNYKVANIKKFKGTIKSPTNLELNENAEKLIFSKFFRPKNFLYPWRIFYILHIMMFQPIYFVKKSLKIFKLNLMTWSKS